MVKQVIASKNAVAFRRAAGELNEGVGVIARCHRHKCVQQLRGTRKGWSHSAGLSAGYVFEAVGKARAIY
ncbi:hypothetical protein Lupro_11880 [Lutibacter profundi]|uniref:Uncharacterized protein n=1 Tax=Lutibacter profundi TaxID=1622118 RepID=A0A109RP38_9FLAO|nr:hypothetical protein Lupro_11880 [Lutibacter profundi]